MEVVSAVGRLQDSKDSFTQHSLQPLPGWTTSGMHPVNCQLPPHPIPIDAIPLITAGNLQGIRPVCTPPLQASKGDGRQNSRMAFLAVRWGNGSRAQWSLQRMNEC